MAEHTNPPRPQGDPLADAAGETNREENRAQRQSDAPPGSTAADRGRGGEESERDRGRGSDANGITAFDEADGAKRRKQYGEGADLVSRTD